MPPVTILNVLSLLYKGSTQGGFITPSPLKTTGNLPSSGTGGTDCFLPVLSRGKGLGHRSVDECVIGLCCSEVLAENVQSEWRVRVAPPVASIASSSYAPMAALEQVQW